MALVIVGLSPPRTWPHVFAYPTNPADAERVEGAFSSAGVANVRHY